MTKSITAYAVFWYDEVVERLWLDPSFIRSTPEEARDAARAAKSAASLRSWWQYNQPRLVRKVQIEWEG